MYVPDDLRHCLIIALDEEPSTTALEHHLPTIRDVIIRLLQGLKRKQAQFRDRSESDQANGSQRSSKLGGNRNSTRSSQPPPRSSERPETFRKTSSELGQTPRSSMDVRVMSPTNSSRSESPSPSSSTSGDRLSRRQASFIQQRPPSPSTARPPGSGNVLSREYSGDFDMNDPKTADALAALKRQENLARRSSVRRASALYRSTSNVSTRSTGRPRLGSDSKELVPPVPMLPEKDDETGLQPPSVTQDLKDGVEETGIYSELDKLKNPPLSNEQNEVHAGKKLILLVSKSCLGIACAYPIGVAALNVPNLISKSSFKIYLTPGTMDIYLKLGKQVKKVQYEGAVELPALRMIFIEKFPHIARNDHFPAIYIFSPTAQISYELENMSDVKHESVLTLEPEGKEDLCFWREDLDMLT